MRKGKAPPDTAHQRVIDSWCAQWSARMGGEKYPFNGGRDAKAVKELRRAVDDDEKLQRLMGVYLQLDDAWIQEQGYSLHVFAARLPLVMRVARGQGQPAVSKRLRGLAEWASESPRK